MPLTHVYINGDLESYFIQVSQALQSPNLSKVKVKLKNRLEIVKLFSWLKMNSKKSSTLIQENRLEIKSNGVKISDQECQEIYDEIDLNELYSSIHANTCKITDLKLKSFLKYLQLESDKNNKLYLFYKATQSFSLRELCKNYGYDSRTIIEFLLTEEYIGIFNKTLNVNIYGSDTVKKFYDDADLVRELFLHRDTNFNLSDLFFIMLMKTSAKQNRQKINIAQKNIEKKAAKALSNKEACSNDQAA